jgi:hypothetical protein
LKTAERQTTKCTKETKDNNFRILGVLGALGGEFALQISKQVWQATSWCGALESPASVTDNPKGVR